MDASPRLKVIELYAGPGAGKSTLRAGLFNLMKSLGHRVEEVTEFAKDLTYQKDHGSLRNQLYILAQQEVRQFRLRDQVDIAITDSPLPLSLAYMTPDYEGWLEDAVWGAWDLYESFPVFVRRRKAYQPYGRNQTESQALALDLQIRDLWNEARHAAGCGLEVDGTPTAPYAVYAWLTSLGAVNQEAAA